MARANAPSAPQDSASASRSPNVNTVTITPALVDEVLATGLLTRLDADLTERYPGEPINGIVPSEFRTAGGYFVLAHCEARPVGCGAIWPYNAGTCEIKRMFVLPEFRGRGIARRCGMNIAGWLRFLIPGCVRVRSSRFRLRRGKPFEPLWG